MTAALTALGDVINLRGLFIAIPLLVLVMVFWRVLARMKFKRRARPGHLMYYEVPEKNAADCFALLNQHSPEDVFSYKLEGATNGGWYIRFTQHNATQQPLDTLYLMQFVGSEPVLLSLTFVHEAFGMTDPVIGEELLDSFYAAKLGAVRGQPPQEDEDA